jgi:hypothetical protein
MLDAHFTAQRGQFNIEMPLHVEQEILVLCGPSGVMSYAFNLSILTA